MHLNTQLKCILFGSFRNYSYLCKQIKQEDNKNNNNHFSPSASRLSDKNMIYGIYVTKENFDIFEDGSKERTSTSQGWYQDVYYHSMKSAKKGLATAKDSLNEDFYDVTEINSVTIKGVRESYYDGERFAPVKSEERVVYHIEKR